MDMPGKTSGRHLKKVFILIFAFVAVMSAVAYYSIRIEPNNLVLTKYLIDLPADKSSASGMKIILIADLHANSGELGVDNLNRMVEMVNENEPDLVLIAGDFMRTHAAEGIMPPDDITAYLSKIRSKYGIVAVLGNHDWWHGGDEVISALRKAGITVLENESVKIGSRLNIAGASDYYSRNSQPDVNASLRGIDKSLPTILMTHSPQLFPEIPTEVVLTVAGHTHGGQVEVPLFGALFLPVPREFYRYKYGLFNEEGRRIIVTKGIGTSLANVRFNCSPEVVMITLR